MQFKDLKRGAYFRLLTSNIVWRKVSDEKAALGEDEPWGEKVPFTSMSEVIETTAFESFWQDLKDRNIIPPNEGTDAKYYAELGFNAKAEKEKKAAAVHDELMLSDPDYKERFETLTFKKDKRYTVVLETVDTAATRQFYHAMYGGDDELVCGCRVRVINFNDINAKYDGVIAQLAEIVANK